MVLHLVYFFVYLVINERKYLTREINYCVNTKILYKYKTTVKTLLTVDIRESKTLTANAVPHANGCVRYSSVSGSSSSSWSRNCTLLSLTNSENIFRMIVTFLSC